ncbi:MAG TPA: tetratricopeptide repeat protein, partial [Anaerolineales bacterium]
MAGSEDIFQKAMNMGHSVAWDLQWDQAAAAYRKALDEFPDNPKALSSLGLALFELQQYDESLQVYLKAAQVAPNDPVPLENVGQLSERLGNNQEAIISYMKAAEVYIRNQDADKALANWARVTQLDPEHVTAHSYLSMVHERLGHAQQAAAEYLLLASLLQRAGSTEKAMEYVTRAMRLDPDNTEADQAQTLLLSGQLLPKPVQPEDVTDQPILSPLKKEPSLNIADTGLDPVDEAHKLALSRLAKILFDYTDAAGNLQVPKLGMQAIARGQGEQDPKQSERANIMLCIGQAIDAQTNDQEAQAAEELEKALAAGFADPALYFDLGLLRSKGGQQEAAIRHLQIAAKNSEYAVGAHLLLAQNQHQLGRLPEAVIESLEALKFADALVVPPDQADAIRQFYEPLIEAQAKQTDTAVLEQVCDNVRKLLLRPNWRSEVLMARDQLPKSEEGMPPMPLAGILAQTQSSE